jgi:hypothetical protein
MDKKVESRLKTTAVKTAERKKEVLEALKSVLGIVSAACDKASVTRGTFYRWCETDKAFDESVKEITERAIDFAESKLLEQIKDGNTTATIFYLKTKGKARGYVERSELTGIDGAPVSTSLSVTVIDSKTKDAVKKLMSGG